MMQTLKTIWAVIKSCPKAVSYFISAIAIIKQICDYVGWDKVHIVLNAIGELLKSTAPPITTDSTGTTPAHTEREKRKILNRLLNRLGLMSHLSDGEVENICAANNVIHYNTEVA
jgi:hypothetical protein